MNRPHSTRKVWDSVSKDTELSVVRFMLEYCTPLTYHDPEQVGVLSDEDVTEDWGSVREEVIKKFKKNRPKTSGEGHIPWTTRKWIDPCVHPV